MYGFLSTLQRKLESGSFELNFRVAFVLSVFGFGCFEIVVSGAIRSYSWAPMSGAVPWNLGMPSRSNALTPSSSSPPLIVGESKSWRKSPTTGLTRSGSSVWLPAVPGVVIVVVPSPSSEVVE